MEFNLIVGELYAYKDSSFVSPLRVGYFLGMIEAQKLSQSYNDDIDTEPCYVFATKPGKELWGKHNARVPIHCLTDVWKTSEHGKMTPQEESLQLIIDIGFDYDGYHSAKDLKELIDELVGIARDGLKGIRPGEIGASTSADWFKK